AVIGIRDKTILVRVELIGVHEIPVQPLDPERNAIEQRVWLARVERIPAHMWDLQAWITRRDAVDLAANPAKAFDHLIFAPALGHQLHADTDAEERPAFFTHRLVQRL